MRRISLVLGALLAAPLAQRANPATLEERLGACAEARERIMARFAAASLPYPPREIWLAGFKTERQLDLIVKSSRGGWHCVASYPVLGIGSELGPKLHRGDRRTPEGFYRVTFLNPNSLFHLSLQLNYPNTLDREQGTRDGRADLGSDIVMHGGWISAGCLAIGDDAIEELFVLTADTGILNVRVVLSPIDFRVAQLPDAHVAGLAPWVRELYGRIASQLEQLGCRSERGGSRIAAPASAQGD